MASILSVNVGRSVAGAGPRGRASGIDKRPVDSIEVRDPGPRQEGLGSGVVGDAIVSRRHHGGTGQAVYAVAREELDWWGAELGRDLPNGMFGENLTTFDLDVDGAIVGERWVVGEGVDAVVLEVTGPRVPCQTFTMHMKEKRWVKRFSERGRTGAYLSVLSAGMITPGMAVRVVDRPTHGITVPEVFRAWMGDQELAGRVVAARVLAEPHHSELAATLR